MIFFYAFLLSVTLLGSITVGPLTVRVLMTIVMILYLFHLKAHKLQKVYTSIDYSFLKLYIVFLLLMGIAQLLNGEIVEYQYLKKLFAYHVVCIVTFIAIEYYINSYNDLKRVILLLTIVMLLNNITSILQFIGNDLGWRIGMFFSDIQNKADFADTHDSLLGISLTPGFFGHVVNNAFSIAVLCPLSLSLIDKPTNFSLKIFVIISLIIAFITCFVTQQRAAFALFLVSIAIYMFVVFKRNFYLSLLFILIVLMIGTKIDITDLDIDVGRLSKTENDDRRDLYIHAFKFITEHPILGGPMSYQKLAGLSSHNIALDSWIFAGFFGFIAMMVLYTKTIVVSIKTMIKGIMVNAQNRYMVFCSLSVLIAMLYGLSHNTSYLTGNVIIFIPLALMLKTTRIKYN